MAKFQFRLSTLQRLRESHRDEMRSKLAEAYQAERLLGERADAIRAEEVKLREAQREFLQDANTDANRLLDVQRYAAALKGQLSTIQSQSKVLAEEIEKRRQALWWTPTSRFEFSKTSRTAADRTPSSAAERRSKTLDEIASQRWEVDRI